jgi:hypothetical protein
MHSETSKELRALDLALYRERGTKPRRVDAARVSLAFRFVRVAGELDFNFGQVQVGRTSQHEDANTHG